MKRMVIAAIVMSVAWISAYGRNAQELKSALAGIMPAGKKARLVWLNGGPFTEFANDATNTVIKVCDSDDGMIRTLYPASGNGNLCNVSITADGSRILVADKSAGQIVVINWDGTGVRKINQPGRNHPMYEYWRNPSDNSDWAVVALDGTSRVNIDNSTQSVKVASCHPGDGTGLSGDGLRCLGYNGQFGLYTVPSMAWTGGGAGCNGSMSIANAPYRYGHNNSGHGEWVMHDGSGAQIASLKTAVTITAWLKQNGHSNSSCYAWPTAEATRFTQHADFISVQIAQSKVNPILWRISDSKFIHIEDNLPCTFCGDLDAVFLPAGGTDVAFKETRPVALGHLRKTTDGETFSIEGRRLDRRVEKTARRGGVVISRAAGRCARSLLSE